jgi:hypothetical protein
LSGRRGRRFIGGGIALLALIGGLGPGAVASTAAEPVEPIACEGDSCQPLPSPPVDPTLTTLLPGPGNPPVRYQKAGGRRSHQNRHRKHRHEQRQQKSGR